MTVTARPSTRYFISPQELATALGLPEPTEEQATVIAAPVEPSLVVAGAGAGKTETMAARVVWLVANGLVTPERVLGLTFTRKAARQLAERVRARLRRLGGSALLDELDPTGERRAAVLLGEPTVLTYNAYAGRLVAEHGLRLPVEPGARLLTETAAWQLAHRVVSTWDGELDTERVPTTVTEYLLALAGELAEHLLSQDRLRDYSHWLTETIKAAPKAPRQKDELSQKLRDIVTAQDLRLAMLPLVEAYTAAKRAAGAIDFADQLTLAARLAAEHPEVAEGERERYGAILLDEYQDTGHAQRILLRSLFGGGSDRLPVTAVGDPAQAIYGWRGASAANLPRFTSDFPIDGQLAEQYELLTSFRNPPEVLAMANTAAEPLRASGLAVSRLRPRDGAARGDVQCALLPDIVAERGWVADAVAQRWQQRVEQTGEPPTTAVLVRRRADMAPLAAELRARGVPVEVVGLGGLLDEPEVRDLVSTLRVLVDPLAGPAAARLLTGSRWRLGAADLAALWARAQELAVAAGRVESGRTVAGVDVLGALPGEQAEQAGLVDALDDPGDPEQYSAIGYRRIRRLGRELAALRRRLDAPLTDLVADVERTMGLDIEAMSRRSIGRAHLDAFAHVVADYAAASQTASLTALLGYLAAAERAEDGFEPGEVEVAADRVQLLTVHAAKGLEWEVVAVPHLCNGLFPGKRRSSCWLKTVTELPAALRGDAIDLPDLRLAPDLNRKEVEETLLAHDEAFEERRRDEERRLFYVALTRAERSLLVSGHWWPERGSQLRGPSPFLLECQAELAAEPELGEVAHWAEEPAPDAENPLAAQVRTTQWPADPLGARRDAVAEGAEMVRAEIERLRAVREEPPLPLAEPADQLALDWDEPPLEEPPQEEDDPDADPDPENWAADVDVLLAERASARERRELLNLPDHLSVSQLVELAEDPEALARRLRRPLPFPPNPSARRGTAFHAWLENWFGSNKLLELDELPGAADEDAAPDTELESLQKAFLASEWALQTPYEVEVPFETEVDGVAVRGRMDAVFADADGGWTVVDWKTGAIPEDEHLRALSVQLAAYRLAWASLSGAPLEKVRAVFHYVKHDHTVHPVDLLDAEGLRGLLRTVPTE